MKIQFLESSLPGFRWMRKYYRDRPQLQDNANVNYRKAKKLLQDRIVTGKKFEGMDGVFERSVLGTPFSILYTRKDETIYVIDIRDGRGYRGDDALRQYTQHLKKKYDL